jgi:thiol peroxidase
VRERVGEAFELGEQLTVVGPRLRAGDRAPDFALESFDSGEGVLQTVRLSDSAGKVRLLNVINSVDTPVCHIETRRWEGLRGDLPPKVVLATVSMDLPFALARWQNAESAAQEFLSSHKNEDFGRAYGVLLKEWRLLQRAVFVIDQQDRIVHAEYVADQMEQPNYDDAVSAVRSAAETRG